MRDLSIIFKALSDETRLRIIKLLEQGELCVCDIVAALDVVQPRASFHLGVLKSAGIIKDRKQGKWIHYSLDGSDPFRRKLIASLIEKADGKSTVADRKRLARFLRLKKKGPGCSSQRSMSGE